MNDKAAVGKSYQDFLTLWKDADPDIPIHLAWTTRSDAIEFPRTEDFPWK